MPAKVLIVEDETLVAAHLEDTLEDLGFIPIGVAPDKSAALELTKHRPDLALVDVNLRDGATGIEIGQALARDHGVGVIFVTANPRQLGPGVPGTLGVLTKPCDEIAISAALAFALQCRRGMPIPRPPELQTFQGCCS